MQAEGPLTDDKKTEPAAAADPVAAAAIAAADKKPVPEGEAHPAAGDPAADAAAAAAAAEAAKAAPQAANPLDKVGPLPAEKLAASLEKPEFVAAMEAEGYSKDQLLQTAREAALCGEFKKEVGTIRQAKFNKEAAGHFLTIEDGFTGIKDLKSFDKFMVDVMMPLSILTGPDGQPLKNADGTFKTDGTVSNFFRMATQFNDTQEAQIAAKYDQNSDDVKDLQAALDIVSNWRKNGYKLGAKPAELTEAQKAAQAEIDRGRAELDTGKANARAEDTKRFNKRVIDGVEAKLIPRIDEAVNNTALSDALKTRAKEDIFGALAESLNNPAVRGILQNARARGLGDDVLADLVAINMDEIESVFTDVANKVLADYGEDVINRNNKRKEKTDAQIRADQGTPGAGAAAGKPSAQTLSATDIEKTAHDNVITANGGKRPADYQSQLLAEIMKLEVKQKPLSAA